MNQDKEEFEAALNKAWQTQKLVFNAQDTEPPLWFRIAFQDGYIQGLKWSREAFRKLARPTSSLAT